MVSLHRRYPDFLVHSVQQTDLRNLPIGMTVLRSRCYNCNLQKDRPIFLSTEYCKPIYETYPPGMTVLHSRCYKSCNIQSINREIYW